MKNDRPLAYTEDKDVPEIGNKVVLRLVPILSTPNLRSVSVGIL